MTTRRYVLLGVAAFVVFAVVMAPAGLIASRINAIPGATVSDSRGTIWSGSTRVTYAAEPLGRLTWSFRPSALAGLQIGYDAVLADGANRVDARLLAGASQWQAAFTGHVSVARFDALLAQYDIFVPGVLKIDHLHLSGGWNDPLPAAGGELRWDGGEVRYRLGGADYRAHLPELVGFIDSAAGRPELTVYPDENQIPLLLSHLDRDGWLTLAVTQKFTQLVGRPWQGDAAEHVVVVEVQEKLF